MPSIDWNKTRWEREHHWSAHGDEWSYMFGSAAAHWYGFILPRLYPFLPGASTPNARIVEIAPGHGRWTQFLLHHCEQFAGHDISGACIEYCRKRFAERVENKSATFHLTDGLSLAEADDSVDLVFSYDSLVHAERDVMQGYLTHLSRCLKPGGFAFLQHSNLGAYPQLHNFQNAGPYNCRGVSVTTDTMQADARARGLIPLVQEVLNHETQHMNNELTDCISLIQKPAHRNAGGETVVLRNQYYSAIGGLTKEFALPYELCMPK